MSKLRIRNGPYSGREKTLADEGVTIGRDVEAGIQILDRSASRFHCEVFPVGGMYFVRDLDSKNGTYVNGERLEDEELLREGDVIKIGTVELVYETGVAVSDEDSNERIAYSDDASLLSNTLEFRVDDLSDIEDEVHGEDRASEDARSLQMLYQVGKMVASSTDSDLPARVCDYLVATMPAENALLFMRDRSTGKLLPHTVRTADKNGHPVITRTLIRRAMMENRAVLTANAQEDSQFSRKDSAVLKGIGSVICVPLGVGGHVRGVLYLSRSPSEEPLVQRDLELVSAAAVQMGFFFQARDQHRRHQRTLWSALLAMVRLQEERSHCLGCGERCARTAVALSRSLNLPEASQERVRLAGLLHHIGMLNQLAGEDVRGSGFDHLATIEDFDDIVPLVKAAHDHHHATSRTSTDGDSDVEQRVVVVASSFSQMVKQQPEADAVQLIEKLEDDSRLDAEVVRRLKACHLDGTLYAVENTPV